MYLSIQESADVVETLLPMVCSRNKPPGAQRLRRGLHQTLVVAIADVFDHADRDDLVEDPAKLLVIELPIVAAGNGHRQAVAAIFRVCRLFQRNRNADHFDAVDARRIVREAAPAAADVQHTFAALQLELAADEIELGPLCRVEITRILPIGTGIGHRRAQHAARTVRC